jgi:aryl-alcohol dehydrogenase-like predicted oxidoreductase
MTIQRTSSEGVYPYRQQPQSFTRLYSVFTLAHGLFLCWSVPLPMLRATRCAGFDFPVVEMPRALRVVEAMRPIAELPQASVAQVALAWLLSRPQVSTDIIGARTPEQLKDNLAAPGLELTAEHLQTLDDASKLPPEYPGWMLEPQCQSRAKPPVKG